MRYATVFGVILLVLAATTPATAAVSAQESDCAFPVERTDLSGSEVTVEEEPSRVVTLNPSAAQTMWEIGARDKVVGVTKHAMNLEGAEEKTNISSGGETINNEVVVGLEPDLVLAPNTIGNETVTKLREAGLTVYHFGEAKSIQDIQRKTHIIGELTGECEGAEETVGWMQSELEAVDAAVEGTERPGMIYAFFGYTAGNGTFIGTVIERAGATNVAAEAGIEGYKQINEEMLLEQDPDWLLLNSEDDQVPDSPGYQGTTAVEEDQIVVVNYNQLNRPAPRIIYPLVEMTQAIHPDAYAEANESSSKADQNGADAAVSGESGPGFTAVGAVAALVCLSVIATRREG